MKAITDGEHSLVVHIIPAQIYSRQFSLPVNSTTLYYDYEQLKMRKARYMYGWDIMPRIVSVGLWRRTGIIWWNVIDGWPQISDAVMDWYGCKSWRTTTSSGLSSPSV